MTTDLTHRQRVKLALAHQETDRVPIAMVCSGINPPARKELEKFLRDTQGLTVDEYLDPLIDIRGVGPEYIGPALEPGHDIWGVHRGSVDYGAGEYNEIDYYPLAEAQTPADLRKHAWPLAKWYDYAGLPDHLRELREQGDHCLMAANGNIFETSWYMRGFEQLFMDMVLAPELAHGILSRVCDFYVEHFTRILQEAGGEIDLVFTADDIGSQQGLLMSLDMWEEFVKPYHARLNHRIHEFGVKVIYHSDGAVMEAVGGLLDMGIDVLQALQFDARGMDPVLLKEKYGDRLCFEGGVSVQSTLPFGSADDVTHEVENLVKVLGAGGGYILGPSHCIQAGTPAENIVAMFDTARRQIAFAGNHV